MGHSNRILPLTLVLLVNFFDWLGVGLVFPIFSAMLFHPEQAILDPSVTQTVRCWYLGLLLAAMPLAQFFSGPILGSISDQKGRRPLLLLTLLGGALAYFLCMVGIAIKSVILLIFARFAVGIAAGNIAIVSAVIADLSDDASKAKNFGLYSMVYGLGFSLGPFFGGHLSSFGLEIPFFLSGFVILINFVLVYFFFKETYSGGKKIPIRLDQGLKNLVKAFRLTGLRALFLSTLLFCFGWSVFYEFIPVTWIRDFGYNARQIGIAYAYGAGFYALSAGYLIRPLLNRFRPAGLLFYSSILLGLIIPLMIVKPPEFWNWIYLTVLNFLAAIIWPTSTTMVSNLCTKDAQGETLGLFQSLQAAAFGFSPLVAGSLFAAYPVMPLVLGGVSMLLAAAIFGILLRKEVFSR